LPYIGASLSFAKAFHRRGFSPLRRRFCVVSFGFERLMSVSVSCLISVRCDCMVVFAFWFQDEIRDAVGWRFFFNRFGLISECE
jgi:hypothetical protein